MNKYTQYVQNSFVLFFYSHIFLFLLTDSQGDVYTGRHERAINNQIKYAKKHVDDIVLSYRKKLEETPCSSYSNTTVDVSFCEEGYCCDLNPLEECTKTNHIYNETVFDIYTFAHCKHPYTDVKDTGIIETVIFIALSMFLQILVIWALFLVPSLPRISSINPKKHSSFISVCTLRMNLYIIACVVVYTIAIKYIDDPPYERENVRHYLLIYVGVQLVITCILAYMAKNIQTSPNSSENQEENRVVYRELSNDNRGEGDRIVYQRLENNYV